MTYKYKCGNDIITEYYTTNLALLRAGIVKIADSVKEKELQQEEYEL